MSDCKPKRPAPLSLRLSANERACLEADAAGVPLGAHIKQKLFRKGSAAKPDPKALVQILGFLGQSGTANSLNEMTRLARMGALPVTDETEAALIQATEDLASIRRMLIKALGLDDSP